VCRAVMLLSRCPAPEPTTSFKSAVTWHAANSHKTLLSAYNIRNPFSQSFRLGFLADIKVVRI
jgi:hypothetical protein